VQNLSGDIYAEHDPQATHLARSAAGESAVQRVGIRSEWVDAKGINLPCWARAGARIESSKVALDWLR